MLVIPFCYGTGLPALGAMFHLFLLPFSKQEPPMCQLCKRLTLAFSFHLLSSTLITHLSWKFPYLFLRANGSFVTLPRDCVSCRTGLPLQWSPLAKWWTKESAETPECVFESSLCALVLEFATNHTVFSAISSKMYFLPKYFQVEIVSSYQFPTQFCISVIPASSMWVNYNFKEAGVLLPALSSGLCQKAIL